MEEFDQESLVRVFLGEVAENLLSMEDGLLRLETNPDDEETINTVFRMAHSVKGDSACVGFTIVTEFAHAIEDLLDRVRRRDVAVTSELVTLLLRCVDALRDLVEAAVNGRTELGPEEHELLASMAAIAEAKKIVAEKSSQEDDQAKPHHEEHEAIHAARTIRVDSTRLDQMLDLTGELAIARGRLQQLLESIPGAAGEAALESYRDSERMFLELQELVMKIRMVPIGPYFRQQTRVVRDLANKQDKLAALSIEGGDAEIDNTVLEKLRQPLTHMLRNALHHGIESPEERAAAGKDQVGRVTLRAYHEAGTIVVQVEDDGRGIDREALLQRCVDRGLVAENQRPEDRELLEMIFHPGISTAEEINEISGRGVGMDIVLRNVETLHGTVSVESTVGKGTTITIRLPLTLAIIDGFAVSVSGERYIVPHEFVLECIELPGEELRNARGTGVLNLRGLPMPYVSLERLFLLQDDRPVERKNVVVVDCNGVRAGLAVDFLHGQQQVVIKPMSKMFRGLRSFSGSAILGDGRIAMILNVPALIERAQTECAA